MATSWVSVGKASSFLVGKGQKFQVGDSHIAVFRVEGGFRATDNSCPHQGGPLSEGEVSEEVVTCPWHDWRYDLRTGCPVLTPSLATYPTRVESGVVQVQITGIARGQSAEVHKPHGTETPLQPLLDELQSAVTLGEVTKVLALGLRHFVPHNRIGIALLDGDTDKLIQVKTYSDRHIILGDGFAASIAGSSLARLLETGEPRIIDNLEAVLVQRPSSWTRMLVDEGMRANLTLPLLVQGKPRGVLFFSSVVAGAFQEHHVGMLSQIAGQIAISIEKGHWVSDLAQSNERYRILFEMLHEGVFTCDSPESRLTTVHPNLAAWLQSDVSALQARTLSSLFGGDALVRVAEEVAALKSAGMSRVFETSMQREDGSMLPISLRLTRVEEQGELRLMGFVRNLSEVMALNAQLDQRQSLGQLVGKNPEMQKLYDLVRKVAPLLTTVLITGESGTGKELFARAVHDGSERREQAMVSVNCGALSESLLETEWFGHEKGAFTGAVTDRQGRFELADGGTIFLDEIGELSPSTQVKLLRVLQEGEFERVGSSQTRRTNVRVIAATNRNLREAVAQGLFREDLYYRLNVVQLTIPPLRERKDDIPMLIKKFVEKGNKSHQRSIQRVSEAALTKLLAFDYPGNVRQLENVIEHAFVLCQGAIIEVSDLPPEVGAPQDDLVARALHSHNPLATLEQKLIEKVLELTQGNQQRAAQRLGISRTTLWRKLKSFR